MYEGVACVFPPEPEQEAVIVPEPEFDAAVWGNAVGTLIANAQQAAFDRVTAQREEAAQNTLLVLEQASSGNPSETSSSEPIPAHGAEGELTFPVVIQEDVVGLGLENPNKSPAHEGLDH